MGSLSFVMCFSKFIIQQSILYVILFYKKLVKWCYILKELYNLYKDMGGTGNLLARFYCGTVLFYGAEVNRHRIVQEKRYLVIGQKFSNGMVYHYAMG